MSTRPTTTARGAARWTHLGPHPEMRRVREDDAILDAVATTTGAPRDEVVRVVAALRDAVDDRFLDGWSVVAPPFLLRYADDPVVQRLSERCAEATDAEIDHWTAGDVEASARWLGLSVDEYLQHPAASWLLVVLDALGVSDDMQEAERVAAICDARGSAPSRRLASTDSATWVWSETSSGGSSITPTGWSTSGTPCASVISSSSSRTDADRTWSSTSWRTATSARWSSS